LSKNRLKLPLSIEQWHADLQELGFVEVPLDGAVAMASVTLNLPVKDPADRFIVATTLAFDATLVTADPRLLGWPGLLKKQDARL
jgi:PIN domain nuclease of toxin-antitoxin system